MADATEDIEEALKQRREQLRKRQHEEQWEEIKSSLSKLGQQLVPGI